MSSCSGECCAPHVVELLALAKVSGARGVIEAVLEGRLWPTPSLLVALAGLLTRAACDLERAQRRSGRHAT